MLRNIANERVLNEVDKKKLEFSAIFSYSMLFPNMIIHDNN